VDGHQVRKAANVAIDRDSIVKLLNGLVTPAYGEVDRSSHGSASRPRDQYAPDEARKLMTERATARPTP